MGCTSSAPNTITQTAVTADKSIQFEEETSESPSIEVVVADIEDENQTDETSVLPLCDNFEQNVQLARNNKSSSSLVSEKDVPVNGHVIENESIIKPVQEEVKIPKLELFMEKVFENNHHLSELDAKITETDKKDIKEQDSVESKEKNCDSETEKTVESSDTRVTEAENKPEAEDKQEASPSQSQCSRATRWEALADIAAELPPSLAVDPVTGQIYQIALHK